MSKETSPAASPSRHSRRRFLQALGATAALPLAGALPVRAQAPSPAPSPTPPPAPAVPAPTPAAPDPDAAANRADSEALLQILERRTGAQWTAEQREALRSDLEDGVASGRALRKLALTNADEPAVVFAARPPEV